MIWNSGCEGVLQFDLTLCDLAYIILPLNTVKTRLGENTKGNVIKLKDPLKFSWLRIIIRQFILEVDE